MDRRWLGRVCVAFALVACGVATLAPARAQRRREVLLRALLVVDHLWRDGGEYVHDEARLELTLRLARTTGELRATGTLDRHAAELTPSGPARPFVNHAEVEHVWSGPLRVASGRTVLDFDRTTYTQPPTDPDVGLSCAPERVELAAQRGGSPRAESVVRCEPVPEPRWTTHPITYLLAPVRFSREGVHNTIYLQDFGNARITLAKPARR